MPFDLGKVVVAVVGAVEVDGGPFFFDFGHPLWAQTGNFTIDCFRGGERHLGGGAGAINRQW